MGLRHLDAKIGSVETVGQLAAILKGINALEPSWWGVPRIRMSHARFCEFWGASDPGSQMAPWERFELDIIDCSDPYRIRCRQCADGVARPFVGAGETTYASAALNNILFAILNAPRKERKPERGIVRTRGHGAAEGTREIVINIDDSGTVSGNIAAAYERRAPCPHARRGHPHRHWIGSGEDKRLVERWHNETTVKGGTSSATYVIK